MNLAEILTFLYFLKVQRDVKADECPQYVDSEIQICIESSGMYNLGQTISSIISTGKTTESIFCTEGIATAMDCIEKVINNCAHHTEQRQMMDLLVDVNKLRTNFDFFCANLHVLASNKSCFSNLHYVGHCVEEASSYLEENSSGLNVKSVLDNLCRLFDSISRCYIVSFPPSCNMTSELFFRLFNGARYPYCDLSELQREIILLDILSYNSSGKSHFIVTSFNLILSQLAFQVLI